jgi:phage terminase large subunit-like protein
MSSSSAVLSAKPRVRRAPRAHSNEVDDAVFLSSSYGLTPDDWQEDALESWLGRKRDGRWAAATCGLAVPRQNGKNGAIEVRELFGMVELGEKFLHTAHEVKTARKAFRRIASFFENEREYPELAALAKEIRKTNGQEAIVLTNGGSVEFIARSRGSGRGFTVDVLVCDEAQELTNEELEALLPTISAAPSGNPQVILTGTPPKPDRPQGEAFRAVRKAGEANTDARLAWTDFGVEDGPIPDVTDRQLWFAVNPALGSRLQVAEVERELGLMSPEGFAVERLGWWGDPAVTADGMFPLELWNEQRATPLTVIRRRSAWT